MQPVKNRFLIPMRSAALCGLLLLCANIGAAHARTPGIFAITDVRIVTAPGQTIERGTVVLRDGLIESVGAGVAAPPDAAVITGKADWTVYPAFIDAASSVGLEQDTNGAAPRRPGGNGDKQRPGAPHEIESVHPEHAVIDRLDVAHTSVQRHRELGFAVAHVLPARGVFRGASAVILLREAPAPELVLIDRMSQVVALETSSFMARKYPSSSIGAVAAIRQTLLDAQRQQAWTERYAATPAGMRHPHYRASDAALMAVLRRDTPVVFVSRARLDPARFRAFKDEFELNAMVVGDGLTQSVDELTAAGMPLLLPLTMPDKPDLADADDARETTLRQLQTFVRAPGVPAALASAGTEFAFVTAGMKSVRDFSKNLAAVVDAGLSPARALAAVTTVPAALLGLDRTLGTIEPGKQANLMVVEGELFTAKPAFRHRFVDGYHEEVDAEETIGDPNAVVDPRGTWEINTEVMGRSGESTWTISGSAEAYRGFSESPRAGKRDFTNVELRGNALTVVSETPRGEVDVTVIITGETLAGKTTMDSPRGSATMTVEGRRITGPERNEP